MSKEILKKSENKVAGVYLCYPKCEGDIEGGLRTKGIIKENNDEQPLITYVTVVYNRVDTIEDCIRSVINQKNANVEYIIVDGASNDGTLDIIKSYEDSIDYYISQKDGGIYNAMNKGIALARGQYICFMNSDDSCTKDAANIVTQKILETKADIICGTRDFYQNGERQEEVTFPRKPIKYSCFRYIQMYHQATYASAKVFDAIGGFDERYSLLADWIWESKAIDNGFMVEFIGDSLTRFNYDGASFKGIKKRDEEWYAWTEETFDCLSIEDAELFVNCLDRERAPDFSMSEINKYAQKYMYDKKFKYAFYETLLQVVIENIYEMLLSDLIEDKWLLHEDYNKVEKELDSILQNQNNIEESYRDNIDYICKLHDKIFSKYRSRMKLLKYKSNTHENFIGLLISIKVIGTNSLLVLKNIFMICVYFLFGSFITNGKMKYIRNFYKIKRERWTN